MAISKVILNGEVQMDVTSDTVEANKLLEGETATKNDGTKVTGTFVAPDPVIDSLTVTPTEEQQTFNSSNVDGYKPVSVGAISSTYVGSGIARRSSSNLTASGATVTAPAGYYSTNATKSVASGTAGTPKATKGTVSNHSVSVTPSVTNTTGYISGGTKTGTAVTVAASELVSGTKSISANGSGIDVTNYASVDVAVPNIPAVLQEKSVSPTESAQTVTADSGYDGLSEVEVGAISSTYVGSGVARKSSTDLTASGATVTAPAGYYAEAASKSISGGSAKTPTTSITANPTIGINSSGLITASTSASKSIAPEVSAGYISIGTSGTVMVSGSNTKQLTTQASKTIIPSESEQTAVATNVYTTGEVKVGAIDSEYVGSGISRKSSTDLTVSGATVSVPAGYYAESASKAVASGTAGTPVATKGTVNNHSVSVTPSVTNTTGYITGETKTGTAVTVTASELVSGSQTITENDTYDVTNLAEVVVNVTGGAYVWQDAQSYVNLSDDAESPTISTVPLTVTESGTYTAPSGMAYTPVSVNIPSYTLLYSDEVSVNTTSTSATFLKTFTEISSTWISDAMLYVRVRDKAGKRNTYYYGSDQFISNEYPVQGISSTTITASSGEWSCAFAYRYNGALYSKAYNTTPYGIYVSRMTGAADDHASISMYARYGSSDTLTINGTYSIEIYRLSWPGDISPYTD